MAQLPTGPGGSHIAITPDDNNDVDRNIRSLRIGVAGDMAVRDQNDVDITYPVLAGEVFPFVAKRILSSGTTATNIVGWR